MEINKDQSMGLTANEKDMHEESDDQYFAYVYIVVFSCEFGACAFQIESVQNA
jgi:hypothetical protein